MDSWFIDPSALPGGRDWLAACTAAAAATHEHAPEHVRSTAAVVSETLRCHVSASSGFVQVMLLIAVYAGILFKASQLIANGSELLLLVPSLRHLVGSVVLPILGAVPDGAIVLFSGLGDNAQEELSVGVGALAGSTSMLLTLPWFLAIVAGRVSIRPDGVPTYHHRPKLFPPGHFHLSRTGVQPLGMVRIAGQIMLITSISYFVIQGAAFRSGTFFKANETPQLTALAAQSEHWPAFFCFIVCTAFFVWYLYYSVTSKSEDEEAYFQTFVDEIKQKAIRKGQVSLTAAYQEIWVHGRVAASAEETTGLIDSEEQRSRERLGVLLRTFFSHYDHDGSKSIDRLELQNLMRDLGEFVTADEIAEMYTEMDHNADGLINVNEFVAFMPNFIIQRSRSRSTVQTPGTQAPTDAEGGQQVDEENTGEEEEEEVPDDLRHDDPKKQVAKVMQRAFLMMAVGTVLVIVFSDPMVSVMSDVGRRIGVPPFYISFLLAPLASNASELIAAHSYAAKKTRKTVTISFSTLLGAAIMNNTFVLSIFMLLLTTKHLAWTFTAETISILAVEIIIGMMSMKKVMTLGDGFAILAMFPGSLLLVAFLENVVGLD